jgi:hypothetical protein
VWEAALGFRGGGGGGGGGAALTKNSLKSRKSLECIEMSQKEPENDVNENGEREMRTADEIRRKKNRGFELKEIKKILS